MLPERCESVNGMNKPIEQMIKGKKLYSDAECASAHGQNGVASLPGCLCHARQKNEASLGEKFKIVF